MHGNSSPLGTNVTIPDHLSHSTRLVCEGTPSISFEIMKVMPTLIFVIVIGCCHIGSQRGRVPTQVQARGPGNEGGVGGAGPTK